MNPLSALQEWYASVCDGDWEHSSGVRIETLDNPGWMLVVDLEGTPLHGRLCGAGHESDGGGWITVASDGSAFVAACDPLSLEKAIEAFVEFARSEP